MKASCPGRTAAAQANGVIPAKIEPSALPAAPPISLVQAATLVDKADVDLEPTPEKDRVADRLPTLSIAPVATQKRIIRRRYRLRSMPTGRFRIIARSLFAAFPRRRAYPPGRPIKPAIGAWRPPISAA